MNGFTTALTALLLAAGTTLLAVDPRPRVDIDGRKAKIVMEMVDKPDGGVAGNAEWAGENKPYYLVTQGPPIERSGWQDYTFSFMPKTTGDLLIIWAGYFYRPEGEMQNAKVWTCYDDIEVTGAIVENGNFEEEDAEGGPQGWSVYDKKSQYVKEAGNKYVRAWHNQPAISVIHVTAGQQVTVKAKVKRVEE